VRGDLNSNGSIDLSDVIYLLWHLFEGGPAPPCTKSADSDDTGVVELADGIYLLNHLFLDQPAPARPSVRCGTDRTRDSLGCESYSPCE
jgi:hypothetical protein